MPTSGHSCCWPVEFREALGSRESIQPFGRPARVLRHSSLIVNPMPPRITEQSYRPRVSDRTMVATCRCNRFACCASEIDRGRAPPFPLRKPSQNGPRCQGFATPRGTRAPWTAPGRSEEAIPHKRERRVGKLNDPASKHLALHWRDTHALLRLEKFFRGFQLAG